MYKIFYIYLFYSTVKIKKQKEIYHITSDCDLFVLTQITSLMRTP